MCGGAGRCHLPFYFRCHVVCQEATNPAPKPLSGPQALLVFMCCKTRECISWAKKTRIYGVTQVDVFLLLVMPKLTRSSVPAGPCRHVQIGGSSEPSWSISWGFKCSRSDCLSSEQHAAERRHHCIQHQCWLTYGAKPWQHTFKCSLSSFRACRGLDVCVTQMKHFTLLLVPHSVEITAGPSRLATT